MGKTLRGLSRNKINKKRAKQRRDKRQKKEYEEDDRKKMGHVLSDGSMAN